MTIFAARVIGAAVVTWLMWCTPLGAFATEETHQIEVDNPRASLQYSDNQPAETFLQLAKQRFDARNSGTPPTFCEESWAFEHVQVRGVRLVYLKDSFEGCATQIR